MINRQLHAFLACVLSISLLFAATQARSTPVVAKIEDVPKQIRAALGELRVARTPVMMPTWLPDTCTGPLGVGEGPFNDGYEIWLGTCSADTIFFTSGGKGAVVRTKRMVRLNDGTTAYVSNLKKVCMDWAVGPYCYRVGIAGYGTKADVAELARIANAMKQIPSSLMKSQPAGEDRLAAAYKLQKEFEERDARSKLARLYDSAITAASHGDYARAKSELDELISKWTDCSEMPPLPQVKMALVQVLKKTNHMSEAAALEQVCAKPASDLELELKTSIAQEKEKYDSSAQDAGERNSTRLSLSEARRKLADLYLAEGRYEEGENLYKGAFVDVASIYGRQHPDAVSIAEQYENLLRLWGRSPEMAKQLLKPQAAGHPPVRLELVSATLKKNGADKLIFVLEDEYGAPTAPECWFTKKACFQGEKAGTILWKKPVKLSHGVNMDTAGVDVTGRNTFTLWYTPPGSTARSSEQRYLWDGTNLILKSVTR